jgi:hypothetical protein
MDGGSAMNVDNRQISTVGGALVVVALVGLGARRVAAGTVRAQPVGFSYEARTSQTVDRISMIDSDAKIAP